MANVKNFASKDLTNQPKAVQDAPVDSENYFSIEGKIDLRFKWQPAGSFRLALKWFRKVIGYEVH